MGLKILTVDDSKTMRDMISFTLQKAGHDVLEAEDGTDALAKLGGQVVDLIITDINMPKMDGITLCKRLRAQPAFSSVPILILTTESDQAKKDEGRAVGATGWIVKPFSPERLLQVISKVCP